MIETDFVPTMPLESALLGGRAVTAGQQQTNSPKLTSRVLDLIQVAELLHAHPKTIRLMAQAGKIPGFRVGRLWRFSATRIHEWIDSSQMQAA